MSSTATAPELETFTLEELAARASNALTNAQLRPADPRATVAPDARTLRYYQTLGLIDPPVTHEDRRSRYSVRHLRQVLAVKALQATGATLGQARTRLAGLSDEALDELVASAPTAPSSATRRFWAPPANPPAPASLQRSRPARPAPTEVASFKLTDGVYLTVDPAITSSRPTPAALVAAAGPLLDLLAPTIASPASPTTGDQPSPTTPA